MTQNSLLLQFLEQHPQGITQLDAFNTLGICRLSERIRELERLGVNISHVPAEVPVRDGRTAHVVRYTLDNHIAYG